MLWRPGRESHCGMRVRRRVEGARRAGLPHLGRDEQSRRRIRRGVEPGRQSTCEPTYHVHQNTGGEEAVMFVSQPVDGVIYVGQHRDPMIGLRLPKAEIASLDRWAKANGCTRSEAIRRTIITDCERGKTREVRGLCSSPHHERRSASMCY
jgi:hypothetical protein